MSDTSVRLELFTTFDFDRFISWIDSEELLLTIAGTEFTFPLTHDQLDRYLHYPRSHSFNIIAADNKVVGHVEVLVSDNGMAKIDKLLIGEKSRRGKGIGQSVIQELLTYSFTTLDVQIVELNVFDWNIAGIKCYEKCGFKINHDKKQVFKMGTESWHTINMNIEKEWWEVNREESP